MTVNTEQPFLLMNVRGQLMKFHSVRPKRGAVGPVGGPVIPVKIMLIAAMIITADKVAVMAAQAGLIGIGPDKTMIFQFAVFIGQMTGGAASAVHSGRIGIALIINMTAQTAAAQQIISQGQGRVRGLSFRYLGEIVQLAAAKGRSHGIYLVFQGEME